MKCKSYERNETSIEGHALTTCIVSKGVAWRQMRKWNPARGAHIKSQLNCRLERACHVFSYNIDEKEKKKKKKSERLRFVQNRYQLARNSVTRYLVAWMVFFTVENFEQISIPFRDLQWLLLPHLIKYIFSPVIVIGKTCSCVIYPRTI